MMFNRFNSICLTQHTLELAKVLLLRHLEPHVVDNARDNNWRLTIMGIYSTET